ncbi:MAG: ATP-binding cassette domain-containing protein [Bacteroidia bacterium]|nr:ATP-binding cassette domain-containing protein [Bacteroidia bacterium]
MEIFSAKNIVKRYASHTALDDVSISISKQNVFGLLGPNGAGKTSLIRIMNQITGPDSGELFFEGEKLNQNHISQIGYLPEERGLYKKMEVGEQALYLAQLKGMKRAEAMMKLKEWFEKFEITAWWKKKVEELSKGMQQKVQFIVTVLHEPKLLILDEPFSGFDPINANIIKNEILRLKVNGSTILLSTHNMESVEELCDEIALINKSKKILDGSVKDIRKTYRSNTYEIEFKGNMLGFTTAMWAGAKLLDQRQDGEINRVKVQLLGSNTPNDLLQSVMRVSEIQGLHEIIPTMNDIFIAKVGEGNSVEAQTSLTE